MNYPQILALAGLVCLSSVSVLNAETLVRYDFTSSDVTVARVASVTGSNVTPESFANGAGLTVSSSMLGSPSARSFYANGNQVNEAISATSTDWLGFTINANSGYVLSLESLSFQYAYSFNSGSAPAGPATFDVRSSVDGYATSIGSFTASTGAQSVVNWSTANVVLTDPTFQNRSTITFRIFLNDGTDDNSAAIIRLDTVALSGVASAIPEPSTYALLAGLVGLAWVGSRRRRGCDEIRSPARRGRRGATTGPRATRRRREVGRA